jgi:hypothetical protein
MLLYRTHEKLRAQDGELQGASSAQASIDNAVGIITIDKRDTLP